jgi:chorismate mutase
MGGRVLAFTTPFDTAGDWLESPQRRMITPVADDSAPPDLGAIRDRLDLVDRRLLDVLAERARLIAEVIAVKRAHGIRVVDRSREEEMLDRIGQLAAEGDLDPRIARQVLRAVIDAFTLLEVEQLGPDS